MAAIISGCFGFAGTIGYVIGRIRGYNISDKQWRDAINRQKLAPQYEVQNVG